MKTVPRACGGRSHTETANGSKVQFIRKVGGKLLITFTVVLIAVAAALGVTFAVRGGGVSTSFAADSAFSVGAEGYDDFATAMNAPKTTSSATQRTVTMNSDCTLSSLYTLDEGYFVTLDLNGHALTGDINVSDGAVLVITDTSSNGSGRYEGTAYVPSGAGLEIYRGCIDLSDILDGTLVVDVATGYVFASLAQQDGSTYYKVVTAEEHDGLHG